MNDYSAETINFCDGVCDIYSTDDNGSPKQKKYHLRFGKQVIGSQRYYAAAVANVSITDLIRVPNTDISNYDIVVIRNRQYKIQQIQEIHDGKPPYIILTLTKEGAFRGIG